MRERGKARIDRPDVKDVTVIYSDDHGWNERSRVVHLCMGCIGVNRHPLRLRNRKHFAQMHPQQLEDPERAEA